MKKTLSVIFLVAALLVMSFSLVMAGTGKANVKGKIIGVDAGNSSITIQTEDKGDIEVFFEGTFGFEKEDEGQYVHVKGQYLEDCEVDACVHADWVKIVDPDDVCDDTEGDCDDPDDDCDDTDGDCDDPDDDCDNLEGDCDDPDDDCDDVDSDCESMPKKSAYCPYEAGGIAHPGAIFLANRMDVGVGVVMKQYCNGFGLGQIKLALHTEDILGVGHEKLLDEKRGGKGWGNIWKDLGSNGKPKDKNPSNVEDEGTAPEEEEQGKVPPGQAKKEDEKKVPPGQAKKEDKNKPPKIKDKKKDK